jgi:Domain of unknown function (DUF4129)
MRAVVRTTLIGLLVGTLAYGLIVAASLVTKTWGCLGVNPRVGPATSLPPPCPSVRLHLLGPGRQDVILAVLCAVAAMAAVIATQQGPRTQSNQHLQRYARRLEPVVVVGILVVLATYVAPGVRGFGDGLATAALFFLAWLPARQVAGLWMKLGAAPEEGWSSGAPALHRLTFHVLVGLALALGSGTVVAYFANQHDMHHVHAGTVLLSSSIYALGALALLLFAHYTSLRSTWGRRRMAGGEGVGVRWLLSYTLLLAGLLFVAVIAPTASDSATSFGKSAVGAVFGLAPTNGAKQQSCRTNKFFCGHEPLKDTGLYAKKEPPRQKRPKHLVPGRSDGIEAITRLAFWLIPLVPLVYFLRSRQQQLGGSRIGLLMFSQAVWRRLRSRFTRLQAVLERRLPSTLIDLGASVAFARPGGRSLSTREEIVRYYLNAVAHAQRHGIARRPGQTPEEFEAVLHKRLHTAHEAWATLTADFIETRFSLHAPSSEQPGRARSAWRDTRVAIRHATRTPSRRRP